MLDKRKRVANNNKGLMLQIKEEKGSSNALVEIYDIDWNNSNKGKKIPMGLNNCGSIDHNIFRELQSHFRDAFSSRKQTLQV